MSAESTIPLPRLPRGPHQLSREAVEQSQRNRIVLAVTDVVADKGWGSTSVSDIVARAGVSRSTFYQLFDDRLDCFLAANEIAYGTLMAVMRERLQAGEEQGDLAYAERVSALLGSYLETLAANPGLARVFLVEVYAAGPRAIEQRRRAFEEFVELFLAAHSGGKDGVEAIPEEERMMTEIIVAAVSSFVTNAVGADDVDSIGELHPRIMAVVERLDRLRG
jgi:AcrR family transcriptional regulator